MDKKIIIGMATGILLFMPAGKQAYADIIQYDNSVDWANNVVNGYTVDDFSAYNTKTNGSSQLYATELTTTDGNVTFNVPDPVTAADQLMVSETNGVENRDKVLVATYSSTSLKATFNTDITAFSTDIYNWTSNPYLPPYLYSGTITIETHNGILPSFTNYQVADIDDFYITTNNGDFIDSIIFNDASSGGFGGWVGIDNISYGSASDLNPNAPVPEPASILLFSTGLAGLVGVRRRKKEK